MKVVLARMKPGTTWMCQGRMPMMLMRKLGMKMRRTTIIVLVMMMIMRKLRIMVRGVSRTNSNDQKGMVTLVLIDLPML